MNEARAVFYFQGLKDKYSRPHFLKHKRGREWICLSGAFSFLSYSFSLLSFKVLGRENELKKTGASKVLYEMAVPTFTSFSSFLKKTREGRRERKRRKLQPFLRTLTTFIFLFCSSLSSS